MKPGQLKRTGIKRGTSQLKRSELRAKPPSPEQKKASARRARVRRSKDDVWSAAVLERDGGICQRCGAEASVAHHIYERSTHPAWKWDLRSGSALCWGCHHWVHNEGAASGESWKTGWLARSWQLPTEPTEKAVLWD